MSILALQRQKDPASRLRHRLSRRARTARPPPACATESEDRHQRRRHEPGRLCGEGAGDSREKPAGRSQDRASSPATTCCRDSTNCSPPGTRSPTSTPASRLATVRDRVVSANAYLGAQPIAEALRHGASIVITGRVADASLTVGPAAFELGWTWDDWDRLAGGDRRRPPDRVRRPGHRRPVVQLAGGPGPGQRRLPDRRDRRGRHLSHHQAGRHRRGGQPRDGERATALRGRRPGRVPDAGRGRRFHQRAAARPRPRRGRGDEPEGQPATDRYKVSIAYRDGYAGERHAGDLRPGRARQSAEGRGR